GLFAIFIKEEHHQSSQFNAANMYHFMPFNQGIGFHSIDGTGYYANLGVRPSSHGCIRMKHSDAEKLFEETPLGTLVLATKGYSARTVAFAPKDFVNEKDYDKAEYKKMLANNLYNILKGRYYIEERERFIIDPKIIPVSGVYTSYDVQVPDKQIIPRGYVKFIDKTDQVNIKINKEILLSDSSEEMLKLVSNQEETEIKKAHSKSVNSTDDLVREYFNNPIGVLPYFGPKK
ncbi:MAG: L,D-transpeptidase, partial [Ignavibacteria bacterium]|nr:L,D-transpeptidase [Ignavibacteria bacterium]